MLAQLAELLVRRRHLPRRRFALTCSALWSKSRKPCGRARPSSQTWPQARRMASTLTPPEYPPTASPEKLSTATTSAPTAKTSASGKIRSIESRSEEHTSELQSRQYLVCRLL